MLVFEYSDRPGVIGDVGRILGDAGINIGGMQVSRQDDRAIGVLNVDSAVPAALAAELSEVVEAKTFSVVAVSFRADGADAPHGIRDGFRSFGPVATPSRRRRWRRGHPCHPL